MKPLSVSDWEEFRRKYPVMARFAEKLEEKGLVVVMDV